MPKDARRLKERTFYVVGHDSIIELHQSAARGVTPAELILAAKMVNPPVGDILIPTSMMYHFALDEPVDDEVVILRLLVGDPALNIGDEFLSIFLPHETELHSDVKCYELGAAATEWIYVSEGKYVDFDPDQIVANEGVGNSEVQLWFYTSSASKTVFFMCILNFYFRHRQRVFPNDNAFYDLAYNEIYGNICQ